ncbi:GNAT family acetyltransferase [Niabella soli DSM 19437]|uniref:Protein ElaA n=1 Tax=Niabella soli DSM 19437 TaxID=929713 RepID=W0F1V5_9BACT|nr:GNAT family acetyltransferase [Niabella soli DSM 19437]
MEWTCKAFADLSTIELYQILQLRAAVFVVEQHCVYQDLDGKDLKGYHLIGWHNGAAVAYTRLLPKDVSYREQSIGRVVTAQTYRALGLGRVLMEQSIEASYRLFGKNPIRIGAQQHLKRFYESLGFQQASDVYEEDGIPHIEMVKS